MRKTIARILFVLNGLLATGCYKNHLYVQQELLSKAFLASSHVNTPDPRQAMPPHGKRLLVSWSFPSALFFEECPSLLVTVRFWDQSERQIAYPLDGRSGSAPFAFPDVQEEILTYRVDVLNADGVCLESWKHHFWTEQISVESRASAARMSSAVSSQPKQASVMEMP